MPEEESSLDLGTTEMSEKDIERARREHSADEPGGSTPPTSPAGALRRRARREHSADSPEQFDERNDIPERAEHRAHLLPEEESAGSADPEAQAREVLRDSDLRTELPEAAPDTFIERRNSDETL